ncbi:hypothetical protein [Burkholderia gladioli]|uniref:hypothetical protein n=1 Tax=Burkholderia gladioli TaxID=28095 RepID=UPI00163DEC6F|nr:hypothetical protein [Burkholderia gladioli]MBU9199679.1 hypothetical protein [Burkholderia gladioli]MDN7922351.1 hypothetical protein [Burkholderia gladioli]
MKLKATIFAALISLVSATAAHAGGLEEEFAQYSEKVFTGNLAIPSYYKKMTMAGETTRGN